MHKSHNKTTGEIYFDRKNIDFLRYYTRKAFVFCAAGSLLGFFFWTKIEAVYVWTSTLPISMLFTASLSLAALWFIITWIIAFKSVPVGHSAARIAGRRGLFTFTVMLAVLIACLAGSGMIHWDQDFYYFLRYVNIGMIAEALFAVPLDYGISYLLS
jgi:hypothetical protein